VCLDEVSGSDGRSRGHADTQDHPALRLPQLRLHRVGGVCHRPYLHWAVGCEAFGRGFSDDIIVGMLGPNPTQEHFRLAAYYLTDLAFQANGDGPLGWGSSWRGTPQCTPVDSLASRMTQ
jgi:hypothetical protein